jgi:DNA-binding transcriptional MerR regulator
MALQQTSLFDFDEPAPKPIEATKPILPLINRKPEIITVTEEPIDVAFEPSVKDVVAEQLIETVTEDVAKKKNNRGRLKLSDMDAGVGLIEVPEDDVLFSKKYYSIGLVAQMFKVNISLIRFWEKEFDIIKPKLNGKGDRHFRPEDVKNLKLIYHLLREKKYTIDGARVFLKTNKKSEESFAVIEELKKLQLFLTDLKLSL